VSVPASAQQKAAIEHGAMPPPDSGLLMSTLALAAASGRVTLGTVTLTGRRSSATSGSVATRLRAAREKQGRRNRGNQQNPVQHSKSST